MQGKNGFGAALLGLAIGIATAWAALGASGPAFAQVGACAANDLACRVAVLERRLNEIDARPAPAAAAAPVATATVFEVSRRCISTCAAEAARICADRGFAGGGAPEDWTRDRSGATTLTRVICLR